jgi:hypothetical protein
MRESLVFSADDRSYWDGHADIPQLPLQSELYRRPSSSHIKSAERKIAEENVLSIKEESAHIRRPRRLISQFVEDKVGKKHSRWAFIARFRHKGQFANSKHLAYAPTLVKAQIRIADRIFATLWRETKIIFADRPVANA